MPARLAFLFLLAGACSANPAPPPERPAERPTAGAPTEATPATPAPPAAAAMPATPAALPDAAVATTAKSEAATSVFATSVPAVQGAVTRVGEKQAVEVGGVTITFKYANHKHAVRGNAVGMWGFELAKGGATKEIELRSSEEGFEAEIGEHGVFLVFRHASYTAFDVVLAAKVAPTPLTNEACAAKIDQAVARAGLPRGTSRSQSGGQGIVRVATARWVGRCGVYSQRVWLSAPDPGVP